MRQFIARVLRKIFNVGGLYDVRQALSEIQDRQSEILNAVRRLERQPQPNRGDFDQILNRLYAASFRCRSIVRGDGPDDRNASGLADYYAALAGLVSHHWSSQQALPPDKFPDDDLSLDYALRHGASGTEEAVEPANRLPHYTWQHFFSIPDSGVFLLLGQDDTRTSAVESYDAHGDVFSFDYRTMRCHRATDCLSGSSVAGPWARLGDMLIEQNVFKSVLFVPVDISAEALAGRSNHDPLALALRRIQRELGNRLIPFSAVLWQGGAPDTAVAGQSADYSALQLEVIAAIRELGVFAPVMFDRRSLVDAARGVFAGPSAARSDAAGWAAAIKSQRSLLNKL